MFLKFIILLKKIFRVLYDFIPLKKNIFLFLKIFKLPRNITKHLWFRGKIKIKIENNIYFKMYHYGCLIENELFWYGINGYEKESLKIWKELSKKSNVIFDIGANTGVYSLISAAINPGAKVYAFEPILRNYEKLCYNIKLNNFNIKPYKLAISDTSSTKIIYDTGTFQETAATLSPFYMLTSPINYKVETKSLDDFISENNLLKVDLIKIDVETHEPFVLKGFTNICKHKPYILIEVLYDEVGTEIEKILDLYGIKYYYYFIDENKGIVKMNHIKRISNIYFNYLLVPL